MCPAIVHASKLLWWNRDYMKNAPCISKKECSKMESVILQMQKQLMNQWWLQYLRSHFCSNNRGCGDYFSLSKLSVWSVHRAARLDATLLRFPLRLPLCLSLLLAVTQRLLLKIKSCCFCFTTVWDCLCMCAFFSHLSFHPPISYCFLTIPQVAKINFFFLHLKAPK